MRNRRFALTIYAALILALLAADLVALGKIEPRSGSRRAAPAPTSSASNTPSPSASPTSSPTPGPLSSPERAVMPRGFPQEGRYVEPRVKGADWATLQRATQVEGDPASFYWALLVGINNYKSPTRDNVGSWQDAVALREYLLSIGWRNDHIMLLGNLDATKAGINRGLSWLATKTDSRSVAVFHYAGHEMPFRNGDDGDSEARDVAIWASDNRFILDGDLGRALGAVKAAKMWINLAVCRAGGFNDPGTQGAGRLVTYSSPESELSYEDPDLHHSVFGYYEIVAALQDGRGDSNRDGTVTVQEAFNYARPLVTSYTSARQHPAMADRAGGAFVLKPPEPPKAPPPEPSASASPDSCLVFC